MDITTVDHEVAGRVRIAMDEANASIIGVATATGIPYTTLYRHLARGGFTVHELYLIADFLRISAIDLMVTEAA